MRKHLLAFVCAVSALALVGVVTCEAQDLKVAFVDLQKFASKSCEGADDAEEAHGTHEYKADRPGEQEEGIAGTCRSNCKSRGPC